MKRNICILSIVIIILVLLTYTTYNVFFKEEDYFSSKKSCIKYLNSNITELEYLFNQSEYNSKESYLKLDDGKSYVVKLGENGKYVKLDIDSQGMLGGQYWGLIYCPTDYLNGKEMEIKGNTGKGNNVFITEKIKDNWYFYYDDYDGKVDIDKIKSKR